ncbi:TonB-dependent hemoglobin/transferrin/lactoferrin family receptor [Sphingosinicella sp.]|uniref:TonB-dependent hemoglobin/transferrin/lactoferrin family receptor n=1 Tax=Sphingosinicella sp. TaxID=1917971 RepID=UPI0035B1EC57
MTSTSRAALAAALCYGMTMGAAQAADAAAALDDGTITVTATRSPISIDDAPAVVTVIDEQRIADELVTDIKDLVRFEPGVSVRRAPARFGAALGTTGRAGNEGFTIRGIGGNRVLIQVDGVRVPDGFSFGAQGVGRGDYVDLGLVKSVEILRGPASALYGSDGLSGAVSFVTSNPSDILREGQSFGGLVRGAYSSADEEYSGTAILAARGGTVSGMVAYTRRDYKALDNKGTDDGTGSLRTTPNPQDGESDAVLGRLVWEPGGGHTVRLTGEYVDTSLYANVLSGLSATVERLEAWDTGKRVRAAADWTWEGEGAIDYARVGAYWQDAKDRQYTEEDRTPAADRTRLNTFDNRVIGASVEFRAGFSTGAIAHRISFGGDISETRQKGVRDGTVPPFGETYPTRAFPVTDYTLAGLYVGDEISFADGIVTLFPALRFDHYKLSPQDDPLLPAFAGAGQSDSRVSPKFGVVVKLGEAVRLFGNYGRGFKAPEPSQVNQFFSNLASGYTSIPNPNLGPEKSESIEGGFRVTSDAVRFEASVFHAKFDDFILQKMVSGSFTPADPAIYQFVNVNAAKVDGAEAKLEVKQGGFTGTLAVSYADGTLTNEAGVKSPLDTIDPLKVVAGIGYREVQGRFGGQLIATFGAQKSIGDSVGACSAACWRPGDFLIFDATAFVRIGEAVTLRVGIFNITDKKYAWWSDVRGVGDSSAIKDAYTQPGRTASVSATFRF